GEGVAIGIALDTLYSRNAGLLAPGEAERVLNLLESLGFDLYANELAHVDSEGMPLVLAGLEEFREHLGGELTLTLLKGVGQGCEVHEVNLPKMLDAARELEERHRKRGQKLLRARG